jgi:DNA-binding FadR family transcriptional regulator
MRKTAKPRAAKLQPIVATTEVQGFEKTFSLFKEQLASGALQPGQRLLPERELAQRFGVSRATLREVMRVLTLLGVIEISPGQGAFVTAPSAGALQDFFGILLSMQPTLYDDVVEARLALECQAARLACEHAGKPDIDRLEKALETINRTLEDDSAGGEADFAFHDAIIRASHNEVLLFIHEAIQNLLRRSHLERRLALREEPGLTETLGREHRRIIDAILARDPDRAEDTVRKHFSIGQEYTARIRTEAAKARKGSKE